MAKGIKITDVEERKAFETNVHRCEICELSKSRAIIARRDIKKGTRPFGVMHVDLIDIDPVAFNGVQWAHHAICDFSHFYFSMTGKSKKVLDDGISSVANIVKNQCQGRIVVCVMHTNENTIVEGH